MKGGLPLIVVSLLIASACSTVKPYQRAYLNDSLMKPGGMKAEGFEQGVFNYREGALQSGSTKGKGGCGCN